MILHQHQQRTGTGKWDPIGPQRKICKTSLILSVSGPWTNWPEMAWQRVRGFCFPTNTDLANIFARTDIDFDSFRFLHFFELHISGFSDFQICGFSYSQISGFPDSQISGFPDSQISTWPAGGGEQLRGNSVAALDHKVGEIQGTRAIPWEPHQCKPCLGNKMSSDFSR